MSPVELQSAAGGGSERPSAQARRFYEPQKHSIFCRIRPRRASPAPLLRRPRRGRRFREESRYSLSVLTVRRQQRCNETQPSLRKCNCFSGLKPAGPTATLVAGLRCGRLRPARLCESQKHSPTHGPKHCLTANPILGLAWRENRSRFSRPKNSHSPKPSPVLRPVSASLRLRCRSAAFAVARWDFISILLSQNE